MPHNSNPHSVVPSYDPELSLDGPPGTFSLPRTLSTASSQQSSGSRPPIAAAALPSSSHCRSSSPTYHHHHHASPLTRARSTVSQQQQFSINSNQLTTAYPSGHSLLHHPHNNSGHASPSGGLRPTGSYRSLVSSHSSTTSGGSSQHHHPLSHHYGTSNVHLAHGSPRHHPNQQQQHQQQEQDELLSMQLDEGFGTNYFPSVCDFRGTVVQTDSVHPLCEVDAANEEGEYRGGGGTSFLFKAVRPSSPASALCLPLSSPVASPPTRATTAYHSSSSPRRQPAPAGCQLAVATTGTLFLAHCPPPPPPPSPPSMFLAPHLNPQCPPPAPPPHTTSAAQPSVALATRSPVEHNHCRSPSSSPQPQQEHQMMTRAERQSAVKRALEEWEREQGAATLPFIQLMSTQTPSMMTTSSSGPAPLSATVSVKNSPAASPLASLPPPPPPPTPPVEEGGTPAVSPSSPLPICCRDDPVRIHSATKLNPQVKQQQQQQQEQQQAVVKKPTRSVVTTITVPASGQQKQQQQQQQSEPPTSHDEGSDAALLRMLRCQGEEDTETKSVAATRNNGGDGATSPVAPPSSILSPSPLHVAPPTAVGPRTGSAATAVPPSSTTAAAPQVRRSPPQAPAERPSSSIAPRGGGGGSYRDGERNYNRPEIMTHGDGGGGDKVMMGDFVKITTTAPVAHRAGVVSPSTLLCTDATESDAALLLRNTSPSTASSSNTSSSNSSAASNNHNHHNKVRPSPLVARRGRGGGGGSPLLTFRDLTEEMEELIHVNQPLAGGGGGGGVGCVASNDLDVDQQQKPDSDVGAQHRSRQDSSAQRTPQPPPTTTAKRRSVYHSFLTPTTTNNTNTTSSTASMMMMVGGVSSQASSQLRPSPLLSEGISPRFAPPSSSSASSPPLTLPDFSSVAAMSGYGGQVGERSVNNSNNNNNSSFHNYGSSPTTTRLTLVLSDVRETLQYSQRHNNSGTITSSVAAPLQQVDSGESAGSGRGGGGGGSSGGSGSSRRKVVFYSEEMEEKYDCPGKQLLPPPPAPTLQHSLTHRSSVHQQAPRSPNNQQSVVTRQRQTSLSPSAAHSNKPPLPRRSPS